MSKIICPIKIGIDPMERLLVASFKNDSEFEMIEPQVFDDPINGKGMRILRYRKDKRVDVYWQKGVKIDRQTFTLGGGICDFEETIIDPAHFNISNKGVDLSISFIDAQGRVVELVIKENNIESKGFPFLAPVGKDIERPKQLFLAYMLGFDFVRNRGTRITARIGERKLVPSDFPIRRNFRKVKFLRYSSSPIIGTLNPPIDKALVFDAKPNEKITVDEMTINLDKNSDIKNITSGQLPRQVEIRFSPSFPNFVNFTSHQVNKGTWQYLIANKLITGGTFVQMIKNNIVNIEMAVRMNWNPVDLPLSFKVFTMIAKSFRTWPKTYKWIGQVNLNNYSLTGEWKRNSI